MPKRSPNKKQAVARVEPIAPVIRAIRGQRVILDSDLARIYGVTTKRLNEAVKRNRDRFPSDFTFRVNLDELESLQDLKSQIAISNRSQFATGSEDHMAVGDIFHTSSLNMAP